MSEELREVFKFVSNRLEENEKRGIDSIVIIQPRGITIIGIDQPQK